MAFPIPSPLLGVWQLRLRSALCSIPHPQDSPQAHAPGPAPDRVLIVGSGPAAGWGVLTHDLALPGQLARCLTGRTGRGTEVDLVSTPFMTIRDVVRELRGTRLSRYDAVVVVLGIADVLSLTSAADWEERMTALLRMLQSSCARNAQIVVTGIQPMRSVPEFDSPLGSLLDRRARRFNRLTRALCHDRARTCYVRLAGDTVLNDTAVNDTAVDDTAVDDTVVNDTVVNDTVVNDTVVEGHGEGQSWLYRRWAEQIAARLDASGLAAPARRFRAGADDERERQTELARMGIGGSPGGAALDRIVALAREAFGTAFAAVTLVEADRQLFKAGAGFDLTELPRAVSFCTHTIQQSEALVVPDARRDPRFAGNPLVLRDGMRFYAGYPLESPSGYRIGALCVFDSVPHAADELDLPLLESLAKLAQRELAREAQRAGPARSTDAGQATNSVARFSERPRAIPAR